MNDSRYSTLSGEQATALAGQHAKEIEEHLIKMRETGQKTVVVTHTSPCEETLNPRYEGHWSNDWYWNPACRALLAEYADVIHCWCHGHTHAFADKIVEGVRVICNPRGYPGENPDWRPVTIEIEV